MSNYILATDSCIDLNQTMADELGLEVIPLSVLVEDKVYFNYLDGRDILPHDFYQLIRERKKTSTSQVSTREFISFFKPFLEENKDILYIAFSSALSGTYHSAMQAQSELKKKYPNNKLIVVDSLCASMGQGLLVTYASRLKQEGKSIEEVAKWLEDNKTNVCHLFTVGDLDQLKRGGRLSATTAFIGNLLSIKPLLHVSLEGKLVQAGKVYGRKRSLDALVELMVNSIVDAEGQTVYISHGDCYEDALYVKEKIKAALPVGNIIINYVGPVIGSHSGVGTLAIFYMGKERYLEK